MFVLFVLVHGCVKSTYSNPSYAFFFTKTQLQYMNQVLYLIISPSDYVAIKLFKQLRF